MVLQSSPEMYATDSPKKGIRSMKVQAARGMWRLLLVIGLNCIVNLSLFFDLEDAFLNSLVTCPEPVPDPTCPVGSTLIDARCEAEPRSSPNWSFSSHCADQHFVLNRGRAMSAVFQTAAGICGIVSVLVLGPLADTCGRKPVLILSLCGGFAKSALQLLASVTIGHAKLQKVVILAAIVVFSFTNNFMLAASAMAADLAPGDEGGRAASFSALAFVRSASMAVGFLGGFFILKENFASYTLVWLGSSTANVLITILACFLLRDTLREPSSEETSSSDASSDAGPCCRHRPLARLKATCSVFQDFMRDCILGQFIILWCVFSTTSVSEFLSRQLLLGPLKYSQAFASITSILHPAFLAVGSALSSLCVKQIGAHKVFGAVLFLMALGHALTGLCMVFEGAQQVMFWCGEVIVGLSGGVLFPVAEAIFSVRVDLAKQGMLFSLIHLSQTFGHMLGVQLFIKRMFNSDWTGWKGGAAFFALSAVCLLAIPWLAVITHLDKRATVKADFEGLLLDKSSLAEDGSASESGSGSSSSCSANEGKA